MILTLRCADFCKKGIENQYALRSYNYTRVLLSIVYTILILLTQVDTNQ